MNKLLHFSLGGFICALLTIVTILQDGVVGWDALYFPFVGYAVVFVCVFGKESIISEKFSWVDILISMAGCVCTHIATILGILFYIGSR